MAQHLAEVEILGSSFTVKSEESTDHLAKVIEHFSNRVAEARRAMPQADLLRVAIVSGLNITDELFKALQATSETLNDSEKISQISQRLIGMIDETLVGDWEPSSNVPSSEHQSSPQSTEQTTIQSDNFEETAE